MLGQELDSLFHIILKWDFYKDLEDEEVFTRHLEEDKTWEKLRDKTKINNESGLEKIPLRFSSIEEYIRIYMNLFLYECKAQLARSKYAMDIREEPEKFLLNLVKNEEKRKFFTFELVRNVSRGLGYGQGDLILLHNTLLKEEKQSEHSLAIIDQFTNNVALCRVELDMSIPRCQLFAKSLKKNSEWYITKICNTSTITREYTSLVLFENLKLSDKLLNPSEEQYDFDKKPDDYFKIPVKLDNKLRERFNSSQYEAIKMSIKKKGLTLIQGPPGTGKSTTILGILSVILNSTNQKGNEARKGSMNKQLNDEMDIDDGNKTTNVLYKTHPWLFQENPYYYTDNLDFPIDDLFTFNNYPKDNIMKLIKPTEGDISEPEKILVCAPSNVAIDEIVRKLSTFGVYDKEGNAIKCNFIRIGPNYNSNLKEYSLEYKLTQMENDSHKSIDQRRNELITNAKIVCSTLSMAGSNILLSANCKFDTVVIDEASQAIELSTLIPLKYNCERLILVGDPNQLSATVFSSTALKYNYDQSLFGRFQQAGQSVLVLKTQYRMQSQVSNFISELFYNGMLDNDDSIYKLNPELSANHPAFQPMTFFDIESPEEFQGTSFTNEAQVQIIVELMKKLKTIYKDDIKQLLTKVAILSPYSKQVYQISSALKNEIKFDNPESVIEVNTVDGFQGKEKSIIIFSTVRSKGSQTIGFLSDERRINVGLTRARSCLIVIGDSKTLMKDKNWDKLVRYSFRKGIFYKVKGNIKTYFNNFESNYKKYSAKNEEEFTKLIFSGATASSK